MAADDREQNFERALARHLHGAAPDSCPDAEILAAYHERALSSDEMAHWTQHIAACVRCQETLALVEQTENVSVDEWKHEHVPQPMQEITSPVAARVSAAGASLRAAAPAAASVPDVSAALRDKPRARPPWRWVVSLGAAAAAVIVWVSVQEIRTHHEQLLDRSTKVAENRAPALPPTASPNLPASAGRLPKEAPEAKLISPQERSALPPKRTAPAPSASASANSRSNTALPNQLATRDSTGETILRPSPPAAGYLSKSRAAAAPASVSTAPPSPLLEPEKKQKSENVPPVAAETVEVQAPAATAAASQVTAYQNGLAADLVPRAMADRRYILAPGEKHVWRLGDGGTIQFSTDHGKTWKSQSSGITADLTGGSAPSDKICWAVGKAGTILLTTDGGKHWKLLSSPIAGDLGGVHATDATHASVWDVSNRISFETSDGGSTWTRTAKQ